MKIASMSYPKHFDVIVVGGGHAGTEAALASARMGLATLLISHNIETLGQMSCNPSIGGIGKGHLVKELDAMGGAMARATDEAGIQFRMLNSSKGPAVRATRAQADRVLYKAAIRSRLENQSNLWLFQQAVDDVVVTQRDGQSRVSEVVTQSGIRFNTHTVVLTAGTFLDGRIHIGLQNHSAGRAGDPPAISLSARLKELQLPQGRLKTGTPPRIDGRSIDFSVLQVQPGDGMPGSGVDEVPVFSVMGHASQHPKQVPCWVTHTNERTHEIIRSGFDRSPMFTGVIDGVGPRYCPSVEDKVNRFADKDSHQIFLEPEGLSTHEFYPNGISTSLPFDIQLALVQSMPGLENAHILRPGYAIEYDYFDPRALRQNFETQHIGGLFFAGQINGTTGYEEAAAQGLFAGINAALMVREIKGQSSVSFGSNSWLPARHEAYLGVLVDDLTSKGVTEPYRMFTSRAEYRLQLREDNADARLTPVARQLGLVDDAQWAAFCKKQEAVSRETQRLSSTWLRPHTLLSGEAERVFGQTLEHDYKLADLLRRPQVTYALLMGLQSSEPIANPEIAQLERDDEIANSAWLRHKASVPGLGVVDVASALPSPLLAKAVQDQVEITIKYQGYIDRQIEDVKRAAHIESTALPADLNYNEVSALSVEVRQKLSKHKPTTLGQASRISGVTPAAISLLTIHLKRKGLRITRADPASQAVLQAAA